MVHPGSDLIERFEIELDCRIQTDAASHYYVIFKYSLEFIMGDTKRMLSYYLTLIVDLLK